MSNSMTKKDAARVLETQAPALNGQSIIDAAAISRDVVQEAIRKSRNSLFELLFPSTQTQEIRKFEQAIMLQRLKTDLELQRACDEAGITIVHAALDHIVANGCASAVESTASMLVARRADLEERLNMEWRRFVETVCRERAWVATMPAFARRETLKKTKRNIEGFMHMLETSLRKFESLVDQTVGKR